MSGDVTAVRELMAASDPWPADGGDAGPELDDRALADLLAVLGAPRTEGLAPVRVLPTRHRRGPIGLAAAVVVAVALLVWALGIFGATPSPPAYAATPAPLPVSSTSVPGRPGLERLAVVAASTPVPGQRGVRYGFVEAQTWSLGSRIAGQQVTSAVVPIVTSVWSAPNAAERITTRTAAPEFPTGSSRARWQAEGSPGAVPAVSEQSYGPGAGTLDWEPGTLSTDPAVLAGQLARDYPGSSGPQELLLAVTHLGDEQPVSPALQSAALRVLAGAPGIREFGPVTDRAGRAGIAFGLVSDSVGLPTRFVLIFSPATGQLLDEEQVLLSGGAASLPVHVPAVVAYTLVLRSGYVASWTAHP